MRISDNAGALTALASIATGAVDGTIIGLIARNGHVGIALGIVAAGIIGLTLRFFQTQPIDPDNYFTYPVGSA